MQAYAYSGAGNSFLFFDDREELFAFSEKDEIQKLCADQYDGLVLLQNSSIAKFRMRIFNRDGSEAAMCGNALRCFLVFAFEQRLIEDKSADCLIETADGVKFCRFDGQLILSGMGQAKNFQTHDLEIFGKKTRLYTLDMGVSHAVVFQNGEISIDELGPLLRWHPQFSPNGLNVNLVQKVDEKFFIQTFERGVEKMTLSCGTGACATAVCLNIVKKIPAPISFLTPSKEVLQVSWKENFKEIYLLGPVKKISIPQSKISIN